MARGSTSKTLVWILMALLILGLGGFSVTNFSGRLRVIGSVGDKEISTNRYLQAVQAEMRSVEARFGQPVSFQMAQAMQLDKLALARLIASTALDAENARIGISIGDENLARQLRDVKAFQGLDGKFDRGAYKFYLDRNGLTEAEFEQTIRDEVARGLLQAAVVGGVPTSQSYADLLVGYLAERRDFTWAALTRDDLDAPLPSPDEAALAAYHSAHEPDFTLPETKRLTYVWLSPDMLIDQVELSEDALKEAYADRADEFNQPERRLVERLVFPDTATAEAAKIAIEAGNQSFDDVVAARGLTLEDVDMGDMLQADLGPAGSAVFNADTGATVGPFDTELGPALFRVNGTLPAHSLSFDDARADLKDELAGKGAVHLVDDRREVIENALAGGATLEDLKQEAGMQLGTLDWTPDSSDGPAGYAAFRNAATQVSAGDFPEVIELDDGGLAALRLDEVIPPRLQPLADVRTDVAAAWEKAEQARILGDKARALLPQVDADTDIAALGLTATQEHDITRTEFIDGTPAEFLTAVFDMKPGEARVLDMPDGAILVRLDAILPPDETDPDVTAARDQLISQTRDGLTQDIYQAFVNDAQNRGGLQLDQNAIDAVLTSFQ